MSLYYPPIRYVVPTHEDGMLLKTILQKRIGVSRKLLSRLKLTEQGITLNGTRVYISVKVQAGDLVEIRMEQERSNDMLPQPMELHILYEDEHLLVLNKPAGVIVHPTHGHYTDTLANGVVHYWQEKGWNYRFRAVHRLDQETSGVLVIAKNAYIHQHVSEQMIAGTVDKRYVGFVHGRPSSQTGDIDGPIDRDPLEPHRRIVTPKGYPSLTRYRVCETYPSASMVELKLETGRTHQIRVHMLSIGCPLIGDQMYRHPVYSDQELLPHAPERVEDSNGAVGSLDPLAATIMRLDGYMDRQALHAASLTLMHPIEGKTMEFTAPLPEDMKSLGLALAQEAVTSLCNTTTLEGEPIE
ncbi:23S rRNA pseudouridine1911/1915/1917 synthase [Paenibacillus sp. cl141a]|uniref:RluA family pseudouridine synthase n=1 Tax=Paenibacillus sp. cl141a TaxID=1761877 RepID=UPI0008B127C4|nr:RluA family pseudouridine synthase [Paenibacillus sp. cl141a]SEK84200.1 23S rRNA pseudouridine1911/1915/1917 synthase [Paenibacillus sp. cl141a]